MEEPGMLPGAPGAAAARTAPPDAAGAEAAAARPGRPRLLRAVTMLRRHWLVSALLAAGLVLRAAALTAYHPALIYVDTLKYLYGASPGSEPPGRDTGRGIDRRGAAVRRPLRPVRRGRGGPPGGSGLLPGRAVAPRRGRPAGAHLGARRDRVRVRARHPARAAAPRPYPGQPPLRLRRA